jgi:site-specific DNA recombinase
VTTTAAHRRSRGTSNGREPVPVVRTVIYARKSTEHGLEQEFSSIDNQVEACRSYIRSQRDAGMIEVGEPYTDPGFSAATMNRPALRRLLGAVEAGEIGAVVAYKMDRLSRRQLDLLNLLDLFERKGVRFVSVTEPFTTATPIGRAMISLLGVFAQMERETIAERITDKMRASRQRGMWTGGRPPLGYDVADKRLVVNEGEAAVVREIFETYLRLGSLQDTVEELRRRAIHGKRWTTKDGRETGGQPFARKALRALLTSPYLVGRVRAGDEIVEGQHEAIVDETTWDAVQAMLAEAGAGGRGPHQPSGSMLGGLLSCGACGAPMTPTYTRKGDRRYAYYECTTARRRGAKACPRARVPAARIEQAILRQLRRLAREPTVVEGAVAAARKEAEAATEALVRELQRQQDEGRRLAAERTRLTEAVARADEAPPSLVGRLADVDRQAADTEARVTALRTEVEAARGGVVDEGELCEVLLAFDPVWEHLFPAERARVLRLLIDRVVYTPAPADRIAVTVRPGGVKALAAEARGDGP